MPDPVPGIGFADNFLVLLATIAAAEAYIKPEHRQQARERVKEWFGEGDAPDSGPGERLQNGDDEKPLPLN